MDNIYHYIIKLPDGINEMATPCADGYTIYTSDRLTYEGRQKAYRHAISHILDGDFRKRSVQLIELYAHRGQ